MPAKSKKTKTLGRVGIVPHLIIAALISVLLFFLSYFPFMTVYSMRSYTYSWETGQSVPDYDRDTYKDTCREWTQRKVFPDTFWKRETRVYLCYKPNMLAGATTLPLVIIDNTNGNETLFTAYEDFSPVLIWQWLYAFLISIGLVWVCKRFMK